MSSPFIILRVGPIAFTVARAFGHSIGGPRAHGIISGWLPGLHWLDELAPAAVSAYALDSLNLKKLNSFLPVHIELQLMIDCRHYLASE